MSPCYSFVRNLLKNVTIYSKITQSLRISIGISANMAFMDELDKAILQVLQSDPRMTNRDLAAAVGVAPTTALDRTRALRDRGIIRGATLDLDLSAIGRGVQALIAVRIRPPSRHNIEAFRDWVTGLPDTLGVFVTSGTEDFLIHVAVPDNGSLYEFVIDKLTQRAEIADVRTSVVYEHIRNTNVEPAPAFDLRHRGSS
jgi:DNA-binding Lrp family transcriptional regulator